MLWTAIQLTNLTLDCIPQAPERAFAVVEKRRIIVANDAAQAAGVRSGHGLAAALALAPAIEWIERNPVLETEALAGLAQWALQYTSQVAGIAHGLLLETGGSARLFGGLGALTTLLATDLAAQGFSATLATSPTPAGARMLAASGFAPHLDTLSGLHATLPGLPVAALQSATGYAATFATLGLTTLADVLALPRDGLTRRFGHALVDELDRALGRKPDTVQAMVFPETFRSTITLPAPAESAEALQFACARAFRQLEGFLHARKQVVDRIDLTLHHERARPGMPAGTHSTLTLSFLEPASSSERFNLILRERLNHTALTHRVERVSVSTPHASMATEATRALLPEPARPAQGLAALLERLNARLGPGALETITPNPDHRPGHASLRGSATARVPAPARGEAPGAPAWGPRPVWLVEPPLPLREIGGKPHHDGPLTLVSGPERIESGWWDGDTVTRDYFIAQTAARALVWIFRERSLPTGWFLQGYFA
jgi:protein ImuB